MSARLVGDGQRSHEPDILAESLRGGASVHALSGEENRKLDRLATA
jgi:hypothetical protein